MAYTIISSSLNKGEDTMDTFFEYLVKRKKNSKDFAIAVLLILAALILIFAASYVAFTPLGMFSFPLQILIIYLAYRFISARNVEFEYCVTNGDLDVDKITNRQKRTRVATVESKNIISMAPVGSDKLAPLGNREVTDVTSGAPDKKVYCILYGDGTGKALLFEPTEAMVLEMQRRNPRNIFVD